MEYINFVKKGTIQFVVGLFVGYVLRGIGGLDCIGASAKLATESRVITVFWELIPLNLCKCSKMQNMFNKHVFQVVVKPVLCFR